MASFVYNPFRSSGALDVEANHRQWYDYLQKREFQNDLSKTIRAEGVSYRKELQRNAELASKDISDLRQEFSEATDQQLEAIHEQTQAINESAELVVGSLETGFADLSERLENIDQSIESLSTMLDWRLSQVTHQLKISNLLQENLALLLRIPDFQKERQYFIEQGFKHYKNAALDEDLYNDAVENLLEAEKREPTDYVVLQCIGQIYLYAPKLLDLAKAEAYFRRAAKYAIVESSPDAQQTLDYLAGNVNYALTSQATTPEAAKSVAAEAYFQAGVSCYAQGKFAESVEVSGKAFSLLPSHLESGFLHAKSLSILGEAERASFVLQRLIQEERFYSIKTACDADVGRQPAIRRMLNTLKEDAINVASERLEKVKLMMPADSEVIQYLPQVDRLIQNGNYLDAVKALDELTLPRDWNASPAIFNWWEGSTAVETVLQHDNEIIFKLFCPNSLYLVSVSADSKIRVWDCDSGELLHIFDYVRDDGSLLDAKDFVRGSFCSDEEFLVTDLKVSMQPKITHSGIQAWNVKTGELIRKQLRKNLVVNVDCGILQSFSPDGSVFLTSSGRGEIGLWETTHFSLVRNLSESLNDALSVGFSPDSSMLVSADHSNGLRFWSVNSGDLIKSIPITNLESHPALGKFSRDNSILVLVDSHDRSAQSYSFEYGTWISEFAGNKRGNKNILELDSSGDFVVLDISEIGGESTIACIDVMTGKKQFEIPDSKFVEQVEFCSDGTFLVTGDSIKKEIKFWNAVTGALVNSIGFEHVSLKHKLFELSPDGKRLAVAVEDDRIVVYKGEKSIPLSLEDYVKIEVERTEKLRDNVELKRNAVNYLILERSKRNELENQKQDRIRNLLLEARREIVEQDRKWFGKNFAAAVDRLESAVQLGRREASAQLVELKKQVGNN